MNAVVRMLAVTAVLGAVGCSRQPPWVFTSPTGGYSLKLPATHEKGKVETETFKADVQKMPVEITLHFSARKTDEGVYMMAHADLTEAIDPAQSENILWAFITQCKLRGDHEPEESREFKLGDCPAVEGIVHTRIVQALFTKDRKQENPLVGRVRAILAKNRMILQYYGHMETWKVKDSDGQEFLDSLVLPP